MKTKFVNYLFAILAISAGISCSSDDGAQSSGSVAFKIDGVSYKGTMYVQASQSTGCLSSKDAVITTSDASHIITIVNYKSSSSEVFNAFNSVNSCNNLWVSEISDGGFTGSFSTGGTWQVSGSTFNLNCQTQDGQGNAHTVTASGTLK